MVVVVVQPVEPVVEPLVAIRPGSSRRRLPQEPVYGAQVTNRQPPFHLQDGIAGDVDSFIELQELLMPAGLVQEVREHTAIAPTKGIDREVRGR